jgi:hypothetical protein
MCRLLSPRFAVAAMLTVLLMVTGCSVTVVDIDDGAYKAAWGNGWRPVIQDQSPWLPTSGSPGVCNVGGNQAACVETDQKVGADLRQLLQNLATVKTPPEYASATETVMHGLRTAIQGLNDRDSGISRNDAPLFRQGQDELRSAISLITQGYAQFPPYDRPDPKPFGAN